MDKVRRMKQSGNGNASINGASRCYEIKTELDNLSKLIKQSNDYCAVFEYNTVILDEKHLIRARQYLPEEYGS
jgi:hypothetical protein